MVMWGFGNVFHSRHGEIENRFRYPAFFLHFDVDQEGPLRHLFRTRYLRTLSLRNTDYLDGREGDLYDEAKRFVRERCFYEADKIVLQTFPRMFGYVFNPVSFWFFRRGAVLDAVLCEVRNTFGEKHFYWLRPDSSRPPSNNEINQAEWYRAEKVFHVSPFQNIEGHYLFRFRIDADRSHVDIKYFGDDQELRLTTWINGELSPVAEGNLSTILLKYGWMTPLVMIRIHLQAARLWLRKATFYSKPALPPDKVTK